jgi:hypothetical protein
MNKICPSLDRYVSNLMNSHTSNIEDNQPLGLHSKRHDKNPTLFQIISIRKNLSDFLDRNIQNS